MVASKVHTKIFDSVFGRVQNKILAESLIWFSGVLLISALAQIAIPLSFTPVPVTGQTFAVALVSLLWGRTRAFSVVAGYLLLSVCGLPVLAGGAAFTFGVSAILPSSGYLIGMLVASVVVGGLADRGFAASWPKAFLAATLGSLCIFTCGVIVLSLFVSQFETSLIVAGVLPFLPGDILKNSLASWLASRAYSFKNT
jgi:biotin transport system substrate-specific component